MYSKFQYDFENNLSHYNKKFEKKSKKYTSIETIDNYSQKYSI